MNNKKIETITKMKNIAFFILILFSFNIKAQDYYTVSLHAGKPILDIADFSSANLGFDFSYIYKTSNHFAIGASLGYSNFFMKNNGSSKIEFFIPIAAKFQYTLPKTKIYIETDLGYSIPLNSDFKDGFYAFPKIGYKLTKSEIFIGLQYFNTSIKDFQFNHDGTSAIHTQKSSIGSLNIGYNFIFR